MPPKKTAKKPASPVKRNTRASALKNVKKGKSVSGLIESTEVEELPRVEPELPAGKKTLKQKKKLLSPKKDVKAVIPDVEDDGYPIKIKEAAVIKAVEQLTKWLKTKKESSNSKSSLFDDDDDLSLYLQITNVKFFSKKQTLKPKLIQLPNSTYNLDDFKICLFVKDNLVDSSILSKIESKEIPHLSKIITAQELKGEYKPYEARRKLMNEFDLFLSDDNLITTLPKLLGKIFYSTSKLPLPIRINSTGNKHLSVTTLTNQIEKTIKSVYYIPPMGVNLSINLGLLNQDVSELIENLKVLVDSFKDQQIRSIQLKLKESPSLPIYLTEQLYTNVDILDESETKATATEEPTVRLSKFEKGLVELALDEAQVESIIGKKVQKVEELKKKRKSSDSTAEHDSKKKLKKN